MKRIILIFAIVLIGVNCSYAQDSKLYEKYGDMKGITSVYMPLGWLSGTGIMDKVTSEIDDVDLSPIMNKLTLMVVLNSETEAGIKALSSERSHIIKDKSYQMMFQVKDDDEVVTGYLKTKDGVNAEEFLLFVAEDDEAVIIQLFGDMTVNDIKKVAGSVKP